VIEITCVNPVATSTKIAEAPNKKTYIYLTSYIFATKALPRNPKAMIPGHRRSAGSVDERKFGGVTRKPIHKELSPDAPFLF
jgi:hypothetical protein